MNVCLICVNALRCEYGSVLHFQTIIGAVLACSSQISPSQGSEGAALDFQANQFRDVLIKSNITERYRKLKTQPIQKVSAPFFGVLQDHIYPRYRLNTFRQMGVLFHELERKYTFLESPAFGWLN